MKIAIAADHGGYELKEVIKKYFTDIEWLDLGTDSSDSVDYPDFAHKMAKTLHNNEASLGILICGTGVGISIAANRHKGIRAALIYSSEVARLAKQHNNANVLVFGGRTMNAGDVIGYIKIFLHEDFEDGRHQRRLDKIEQWEEC
ncbi:MAG: ribose 5-phosphate isomerase B [Alphaproteobacteria bacterium]|nr:ribose 5-phosphate isomerase B [Alphaproteobacteria bacterium]MBR3501912.1 ribose 5-phosphate isomerase B [Alphaproteobacteria bacterium]